MKPAEQALKKKSAQSPFLPLFLSPAEDLSPLIASAESLYALNEQLTEFIQEHTDAVCPSCTSVCCADRFGRHDEIDRLSLDLLGLHLPSSERTRDDADACRFHGPRGCILSRAMRPHRCNWFFCAPLLDHMQTQASNQRYRKFIRLLENITAARNRLGIQVRERLRR